MGQNGDLKYHEVVTQDRCAICYQHYCGIIGDQHKSVEWNYDPNPSNNKENIPNDRGK